MQPAPPIPAAHVMPPPLATRSVEPSSQTTYRTPVFFTCCMTPGFSSSRERSSVLSGAVEGSNHGYMLSSKAFVECTSRWLSPFASASLMHCTKPSSASWFECCLRASTTSCSPLLTTTSVCLYGSKCDSTPHDANSDPRAAAKSHGRAANELVFDF